MTAFESGSLGYDSPTPTPHTVHRDPSRLNTIPRTRWLTVPLVFGLGPSPGCQPFLTRRYCSTSRVRSSWYEGMTHPYSRSYRKRRLRCSALLPMLSRISRIVKVLPSSTFQKSQAASFCSPPNGRLVPGAYSICHQRSPFGAYAPGEKSTPLISSDLTITVALMRRLSLQQPEITSAQMLI